MLQIIRDFFLSAETAEEEKIAPAPECAYELRPLTDKHLKELIAANLRCFRKGENYTRHTFSFLLKEPNTLSYRIATPEDPVVAYIFVMSQNGTGHITTVGVLPEHRRRGLALMLMRHAEQALVNRGMTTASLEVRVSNTSAQELYINLGYAIVQRLAGYYNNGEDAFLMIKSLG